MFTERLKKLRKEAGLTQKEIADHFKTSPQSYAQWEKGLRSPSKESLEKLAQFFVEHYLEKVKEDLPEPDFDIEDIMK